MADGLIPAIIEQDPFTIGWVAWQAFGDQVGAALELLIDVRGHLLAMAIIGAV